MENLPRTRKEALSIESPYYFTGILCKYGHVSKRQTLSGNCVECRKTTHADSITQHAARYYKTTREDKRVKTNNELIKKASNHRQNWTVKDIETATEKDTNGNYILTSKEVATLLGRSLRGVQQLRNRLNSQTNGA